MPGGVFAPQAGPAALAAAGGLVEAAAFALLAILLITSWERIRPPDPTGRLLIAACLAGSLHGALLFVQPLSGGPALLALDLSRLALWLAVLVSIDRRALDLSARIILTIGLVWALVMTGAGWQMAAASLAMAIAAAGLAMIEQLYHTSGSERWWALKLLCLGLASAFVVDLAHHTGSLPGAPPWLAAIAPVRPFIHSMAVPLILIAAARSPHWGCDVFVSRKAAFSLILTAGVLAWLVLSLGAAGLVTRSAGMLGPPLAVLLGFASALVLALLLMSRAVRARLEVGLSRHFFSYRFDYRDEWARFVRTLAGRERHAPQPLAERVVDAVAEIVGATGGGVWMHEGEGRFRQLAVRHLPAARTARTGSWEDRTLAEALRDRELPIDLLAETRNLPDWLPGPPRVWLLLPLQHRERLFGFMLLAAPHVPRGLDHEERSLLALVALEAASYLAEDEAGRLLAEALQFEAFNRRFAYVMHDVKNLAGQLSLTLANARRHRGDPDFYEDMVQTLDQAVARMNRLIAQLRSDSELTVEPTELGGFISEIIDRRTNQRPIVVKPLPRVVSRIDRQRMDSVLQNLIDNAFDAAAAHANSNGSVAVDLAVEGKDAVVRISDNGAGMPPEFLRKQLFKPFKSSKSRGFGIGLTAARDTVVRLGGTIEVASREGAGTTTYVRLPRVPEVA